MKNRSHVLQSGFTLIEIIVTIAIIAVIIGIAANGFNRMNSGSNVRLQTEIMSSDINAISLSAINSQTFQLGTTAGWGIYLDSDSHIYTMFADLDSDKAYDTNEKFKTVTFNPTLSICLDWESACHTIGTIFFDNVTAVPRMNGTQITTPDLGVILTDNVSTVTKNILLNRFGAISHD